MKSKPGGKPPPKKRASKSAVESPPTSKAAPASNPLRSLFIVSNALARVRGEFVVVEVARGKGDGAWVRDHMEKPDGVVVMLIAVQSCAHAIHAELVEVYGTARATELQAETLNLAGDLLNWSSQRNDLRREDDGPAVQSLYERLERTSQHIANAHAALVQKRRASVCGVDGSWLLAGGVRYTFPQPRQAHAIKLLMEERERAGGVDGHGMREKTLGELIGSQSDNFRILEVFRGHPALRTVLRKTGKGVWALYLNS
jgi:hypothetical protein